MSEKNNPLILFNTINQRQEQKEEGKEEERV